MMFWTTHCTKANQGTQHPRTMYLLQTQRTFDKNMFVQTKWILLDDCKWANELIHQG
jgi:hypothetical protein